MTGDINEILLLPLQLNGFLSTLCLNLLGKFLLRNIGNATENTLQCSVLVFLRVCAEKNPRID